METERASRSESWTARANAPSGLHAGGRHETIRAQAKRRRRRANVLVVTSSAAVLALAVVFHALLTR
jgi:hypothetical protein